MSIKNPLTPAGIEPAPFRFVAQHLNHCATGNIMSMKNHDNAIGNRTWDLTACSAVPEPTALLDKVDYNDARRVFWIRIAFVDCTV